MTLDRVVSLLVAFGLAFLLFRSETDKFTVALIVGYMGVRSAINLAYVQRGAVQEVIEMAREEGGLVPSVLIVVAALLGGVVSTIAIGSFSYYSLIMAMPITIYAVLALYSSALQPTDPDVHR